MRVILLYLFLYFSIISSALAEVITNIEILGNNRISEKTIILFSDIKKNQKYDASKINKILKNLYETDFFEDVKVTFNNGKITINVKENPIIQTIEIKGIKNKTILKTLNNNLNLKEKNSFVEIKVKNDEKKLKNILKVNGYYFSEIVTKIRSNDNNTVDIFYEIDLGKKAYIDKIKFIGDKKIKDRKLKRIIASEENKFWKFISNKKFLDKKRINLDEKLLKNYYKNNGYYSVRINTTSAMILESNNFELVFNIDAGNKHRFNKISLNLPDDFDKKNFIDIINTINKLEGEIYSLNKINEILDEIDKIALQKQFEFINATYNEDVIENNRINLSISLSEGEKLYVEKINIFGNYITNENVIRNVILTDEGDPFNEILFKKSINNIKAKNLFASVKTNIKDGKKIKSKIIDIEVEEKPTGEISAGAGTGTSGSLISFSILENNYLGEGTKLRANLSLSDDTTSGTFSLAKPNYKNSDKSLITSFENSRNDYMSRFGYETRKTGFSFGTQFEQFDDVYFSPEISAFYENLDTSSTASASKKKQEGTYYDTNFSYGLSLNKLNQNFQPSDGFRSTFNQTLPLIADDQSIKNSYEFAKYTKIGDESVLSFIFFAQAINNIDGDVRVSKRVFIPSRKLRGFASGKIGPKDGTDYIGGNYGSAFNVAATLPKLFEDLQNIDFSFFIDTANVFGVDYNSSLDSDKIRSSTGLAIDWFTPIGPLSISFAAPITKADTDETETFRFRIGTTF